MVMVMISLSGTEKVRARGARVLVDAVGVMLLMLRYDLEEGVGSDNSVGVVHETREQPDKTTVGLKHVTSQIFRSHRNHQHRFLRSPLHRRAGTVY